jgi:hypothetical protein
LRRSGADDPNLSPDGPLSSGPTALPCLTIPAVTTRWNRFINIACTWQAPPGPTEPIRSRNRDHLRQLRAGSATSNGGTCSIRSDSGLFVLCLGHISSAIIKEGAMQNGQKNVMGMRRPKPAGSLAARPKRWTPSTAGPQLHGSQSAQRSYERYLALGECRRGGKLLSTR